MALTLTVGVITNNSEALLPDLLTSLASGCDGVDEWHLVIADSGSSDGTVDVARRMRPDAQILVRPNVGFAASVNTVAAADPQTDAVLILSHTARLGPGCATKLVAGLQRPGTGVTVPRLLDSSGQPFASLRRRPTITRAWGEAVLGGRLTRRIPALTHIVSDPGRYNERTLFDWASGGVTMLSRECLIRTGRWDETFFLYSEELDFELRAADEGYAVRLVPDAVATHIGGESHVRPELWALLCANSVRVYSKRHRRPAADMFWAGVLAGEVARVRRGTPTHRAAIAKLMSERSDLLAGRPAKKPEGYE
jgi:N-acetylglucosaminyl-diphospho-decaprenol L-rhamnosyltransferase